MKEHIAALITVCFVGIVGCSTLGGAPAPSLNDICNIENVGATVEDKNLAVRVCKVNYGIDLAYTNGEAVLFWLNSMAARGRVGEDTIFKALTIGQQFDEALTLATKAADDNLPDTALEWLAKANTILLELESLQNGVPQ